MQFQRCVYEKGYAGREITSRRISAAERYLKREADKVALFPELAPTDTPISRLQGFTAQEVESGRWWREHRARQWRQARRALDAMPPVQRRGIIRYFEISGAPKDPVYLLTLIDQAVRYHVSYWAKLRELRIFRLIGEGRLPRSMVLRSPAR